MDLAFNKNEDVMKQSLSDMQQKLDIIYKGGGTKAIAKQHQQEKLTPRERIDYLIDKNKPFIEIGAFTGYEMYAAQGGCSVGGTVASIG
ncbi:MAG: acyl-CoA carboxylase subunit beta, partial [Chitinophagaceae bacterium]|nr:acyl-CoA carboxylase subunit beta [Chitinophagaceae bacterium]